MADDTNKKEEMSTGEKIGEVFGQAKDGLLGFGEKIANKSKEMIDVSRLNSEKSGLEKENEKGIRQIGELGYQNGKFTQEMRDIRVKIKENELRIKEIDEEIEGSKGKYDK